MRSVERRIDRVITTPPPTVGFMGEGHTAVPVVQPGRFDLTDPFILLMDDFIDLPPGRKAGGAHPHAGFEIATFIVEGELRDRDEGVLRAGDVVWTTAGSGVIHNEDVEPVGRSRILQLWFTIPSESRWAPPRLEHVSHDAVPVRRGPGIEARVYSGSSGTVRTNRHSYLPMTMVDVQLDAGAAFAQDLPASHNGFLYVLDGDVVVGASSQTTLTAGQVGWLDRVTAGDSTLLHLTASGDRARVVLYAGERQNVPIVMHGPFVGETRSDLHRVSRDFMEGRMPHLSEVMAQTRTD